MDFAKLKSTFALLDDWEERYEVLLDCGKKLAPYPESERDEDHKVRGCMSQVWLHFEQNPDGTLRWFGDSDALLVKGIIAVVLLIYQNKTPLEITQTNALDLLGELALEGHISMNRRNGLYAMNEKIQRVAQALLC